MFVAEATRWDMAYGGELFCLLKEEKTAKILVFYNRLLFYFI
jgi:hypothetical protein